VLINKNYKSSKKVLFVIGSKAASGYYRMEQVCIELNAMGFLTESIYYDSVNPYNLIGYKDKFDISSNDLSYKTIGIDMTKFDIVIFQMVWFEALFQVVKSLKERNIKTVMEIDDDYTCLPSDNPSFYSFHPRARITVENGQKIIKLIAPKYKQSKNKLIRDRKAEERINTTLKTMFETARTVDMLQVSTPELKESYKKFNPNIVVLENFIDNRLYDKVPKVKNEIPTIGWFGTKTHIGDLQIVNGCIPQNCKFLVAGFPEVKEKLFKNLNNIEYLPPYKLEELPEIIAKCDIGIVPLIDNKFNAGKSDLKGLEFGAMSVPVVASDVPPYRRWIRHGENGFLAKKNKTKFWIRYLQKLVDDKELREQMGKEAKKDAIKRDIKNNIDKWIEVYFK